MRLALLSLLLLAPAGAFACDLGDFGIRVLGSLEPAQACKVHEALTYLRGLRFENPGENARWMYNLPDEGAASGEDVLRWLQHRMRFVRRGLVNGGLAGNMGLARRMLERDGGEMHEHVRSAPWASIALSDRFFAADKIERLGALLHEARHSDGDYHVMRSLVDDEHPDTAHRACLMARLSGSPGGSTLVNESGCDRGLLGAYGYEMVFFFNLAHGCAGCSSSDRSRARDLGTVIALQRLVLFPYDRDRPPL
jgi:hypothetical protein